MLQRAFLVLIFLVIAIGGGAASVWWTLEKATFIGSLSSGPWVAFPAAGTPDADPYSQARHIRTGSLALGPSEGIMLSARQDSNGNPLRRECTYAIQGSIPPAGFWTMYAADPNGKLLPNIGQRRTALHSQMILFEERNQLTINVSAHPLPNNWLSITGSGPMQIVLTLFDTPLAAGSQLTELVLPSIKRVNCNA